MGRKEVHGVIIKIDRSCGNQMTDQSRSKKKTHHSRGKTPRLDIIIQYNVHAVAKKRKGDEKQVRMKGMKGIKHRRKSWFLRCSETTVTAKLDNLEKVEEKRRDGKVNG